MSRKGSKGKPTRKEIEDTLKNMYEGFKYMGEKVRYLEEYCKANEGIFDLFLKFTNKKKEFLDFVNKHLEEKEEKKEVEKPKESS